MERRDLLVIIINKPDKFLVFYPAAKMDNGKQKEKTPVAQEQSQQHNHYKDHRGECPGFERLNVKRHYRFLIFYAEY
jgi:hypothetical protein